MSKKKYKITLEVEVDVNEDATKSQIREYIWSEVGFHTMCYMRPSCYIFNPVYKEPKFKVKSKSIEELRS